MAERLDELLKAAAKAMEDGCDPFHLSFLSEHEVTLDEAYDMSDAIARAVRWYLVAQTHVGLTAALAIGDACGPEMATLALDAWRMDDVAKKLAARR